MKAQIASVLIALIISAPACAQKVRATPPDNGIPPKREQSKTIQAKKEKLPKCGRGSSRREGCTTAMNGGTESGGYTPPNNGGPDNNTERGGRNAGTGTRTGKN